MPGKQVSPITTSQASGLRRRLLAPALATPLSERLTLLIPAHRIGKSWVRSSRSWLIRRTSLLRAHFFDSVVVSDADVRPATSVRGTAVMSGAWSDHKLVDALLNGDETAVEVLFGEQFYAPFIRAFSDRFGIPDDDLRQDLFLQLSEGNWHRLRVWERRCPLKYYLRTLAFHFCCRFARNRQRKCETVSLIDRKGNPVEFEDTAQHEPPRIAEAKDSLAAVVRAIEDLPDRDRLMMYMVLAGRSYAEIARALRLSPEAAAVALFRARERLCKILRQREHATLKEGGHADV
jgi:RNA polymerase sigma factor (sigma-70 family)